MKIAKLKPITEIEQAGLVCCPDWRKRNTSIPTLYRVYPDRTEKRDCCCHWCHVDKGIINFVWAELLDPTELNSLAPIEGAFMDIRLIDIDEGEI
jgi:hypothetical protein